MMDAYYSLNNFLLYEMFTNFNMFCSIIKNWIVGIGNCCLVITINAHSYCLIESQFFQASSYTYALANTMG